MQIKNFVLVPLLLSLFLSQVKSRDANACAKEIRKSRRASTLRGISELSKIAAALHRGAQRELFGTEFGSDVEVRLPEFPPEVILAISFLGGLHATTDSGLRLYFDTLPPGFETWPTERFGIPIDYIATGKFTAASRK